MVCIWLVDVVSRLTKIKVGSTGGLTEQHEHFTRPCMCTPQCNYKDYITKETLQHETRAATSGFNKSRRLCRGRPKKNRKPGDTPVVACGVEQYCIRKMANDVSSGTPWLCPDYKASFRVWTNCSTAPFDEGWYGAQRRCFTLLEARNCWNSSKVNWGPLSGYTWHGIP